MTEAESRVAPKPVPAFTAGAAIGVLGGLIGLGGAEFRLPLLIGVFRFAALEAVILNKVMSLVVVAVALPFRMSAVPLEMVGAHWPIALNLLAGSMAGAWIGAGWALRLRPALFYRIIAMLLTVVAAVLLLGHGGGEGTVPAFSGIGQAVAGLVAGIGIGIVASLIGVAGGEFLIPTLILLYGVDVKLAGSLSLAVSLPTMLVGFARYSRDRSVLVLRQNLRFVAIMAAGSVAGAYLGGQMLGLIPAHLLLPVLAAILVISAIKIWRHA
ncbi:sulfite exporter TauE/SafE family protein [Caenispirillum bisanense]|uniref:sulfite exporter TauE/SafE family protein n=1 Tax=Caenispirillum bisanense TaxID=414052 RepID=UPI0031E1B2D9